MNTNQKILYVDLDNVLVNFQAGIDRLNQQTLIDYEGQIDNVPGLFNKMIPVEGGVEAFIELSALYDTYILSTAPWNNPSAWTDKLLWVKKHIGDYAHKRLILTHHKNLNRGDFLVDDRENNGAKDFHGEWIQFGSERFPDWETVVGYLKKKI